MKRGWWNDQGRIELCHGWVQSPCDECDHDVALKCINKCNELKINKIATCGSELPVEFYRILNLCPPCSINSCQSSTLVKTLCNCWLTPPPQHHLWVPIIGMLVLIFHLVWYCSAPLCHTLLEEKDSIHPVGYCVKTDIWRTELSCRFCKGGSIFLLWFRFIDTNCRNPNTVTIFSHPLLKMHLERILLFSPSDLC